MINKKNLLYISCFGAISILALAGLKHQQPARNKPVACTKSHTVDVFAERGTKQDSISHLPKNTHVEILKSKLGWHNVKTPAAQGWVKGYNIELRSSCEVEGKKLSYIR